MKIIQFINKEEMESLIKESKFIITHGGVGTIIEAMKLNKKIIAVPRLKKYKEHVNNHQLQIIENFDKNGYIIGAFEVNELSEKIEQIEQFKPSKYISNNKDFLMKLEACIELI